MKIITLLENTTTRADLTAEHGLSLYIETQTHKILFDMGQSSAFGSNAEKLGVDLTAVDFAVLSHGHYDHGGGLAEFLEINKTASVYVNRHAFGPHYNDSGKYIGLDLELQKNNRLIFTDGYHTIAEGITLHTVPFPPEDTSGLQVMENGVLRPEDFRHEQYLLLEEKGRRVLISGCSHKGVLQLAEHFHPDVLVGGFHFMKVTEDAVLDRAAAELLRHETTYYTGHCTGQTQYNRLLTTMGPRLNRFAAGSIFEI